MGYERKRVRKGESWRDGRGKGRKKKGGRRHTVIYAETDVDGEQCIGGENVAEEDGDVEEEIVLLVGDSRGLHVDVREDGLHLDPVLGAGGARREGVREEDDDESILCGFHGCGDGGVEMVGHVEGVEGGDEERTPVLRRHGRSAVGGHRGNICGKWNWLQVY